MQSKYEIHPSRLWSICAQLVVKSKMTARLETTYFMLHTEYSLLVSAKITFRCYWQWLFIYVLLDILAWENINCSYLHWARERTQKILTPPDTSTSKRQYKLRRSVHLDWMLKYICSIVVFGIIYLGSTRSSAPEWPIDEICLDWWSRTILS